MTHAAATSLIADVVATSELTPVMQRLLCELDAELQAGRVDLPSWSRITERVRVALADDATETDELARLLGAEAGLAVRVLSMANSTAFARGGRALTDLKFAVLRIGRDNLRSAVYAYALAQLRQAPKFRHLRVHFERLWRASTQVAMHARLIAQRTGACEPDLALLAGLLHNIGKLYLHLRLDAALNDVPEALPVHEVVERWHAQLGAAVARNWQLPESLSAAIAAQHRLEAAAAGEQGLAAVLAAAVLTGAAPDVADETAMHLASFSGFELDAPAWAELISKARDDTTALQVVFTD